jgi:predicted transcriptional regulator
MMNPHESGMKPTERRKGEAGVRLELNGYQQRLIATGMKDAQEGRFIDSSEMRERLTRLKKRNRTA